MLNRLIQFSTFSFSSCRPATGKVSIFCGVGNGAFHAARRALKIIFLVVVEILVVEEIAEFIVHLEILVVIGAFLAGPGAR